MAVSAAKVPGGKKPAQAVKGTGTEAMGAVSVDDASARKAALAEAEVRVADKEKAWLSTLARGLNSNLRLRGKEHVGDHIKVLG